MRWEVLHARGVENATGKDATLLMNGRERRAATQATRASGWRVTFIAYQKLYAKVMRALRVARGLEESDVDGRFRVPEATCCWLRFRQPWAGITELPQPGPPIASAKKEAPRPHRESRRSFSIEQRYHRAGHGPALPQANGSCRTMVWSRSGPVETMLIGQPASSSSERR